MLLLTECLIVHQNSLDWISCYITINAKRLSILCLLFT